MAELEKDTHELQKTIYNIIWHMRGMGREEAWALSPKERQIIFGIINERIKTVQDTGLALL